MQFSAFATAVAGSVLLAGIASTGYSQGKGANPPEMVCRAAFGVASMMEEDGERFSNAESDWATAITSEAELAACDRPPESLLLRSHAMLYDDGNPDTRSIAEQVADYLKKSTAPDKRFGWVMPLMNGVYGKPYGRTALYWLEHAAEIGDPQAVYELGGMYRMGGFHIPKDPQKAVALERQAAELGSAISMYALGVRYLNGDQVARDTKQGLAYMTKAAEYGYEEAPFMLATLYDDGGRGTTYGIRPNARKAKQYALVAAEAGNVDAMMLYVSMLLRDPKSLRHEDEVFYWLDRAVASGDVKANEIIAQVGPRLRANYREANEARNAAKKARRDENLDGLFKVCPTETRCTTFRDQYGNVAWKTCGDFRNYARCE